MKIVQRLISLGADISTKKALKMALKTMGAHEENVDKIYVDLKNSVNKDSFRKVEDSEKVVILPACLRHSGKCKASLTKDGYMCVGCGACKISEIKRRAEEKGCRVFIVPGGSMALEIIKSIRPKAALGVACLNELVQAVENIRIPCQGVQLLKKGCMDTDVDVKEVMDTLDGNGKEI